MSTNNTFCVFPFHQIVLRTDRSISYCCYTKPQSSYNTETVESFWTSDKTAEFRNSVVAGTPVESCSVCYKQEQATGTSPRTDSLRDYKFFDAKRYTQVLKYHKMPNPTFPDRFEFHVGNLCNLKCLTCRPEDSSAFLVENKLLGISNHDQLMYNYSDDEIEKILDTALSDNLTVLDLRGGESMLVPAIKQKLLKIKNKNFLLRIQTNCTVLDDTWKEILNSFEKVEIMMSIDAFGKLNDYMRYPSNWQDINNNVDYFVSRKNIKSYVNCTVSNLNLPKIAELIHWANNKQIYLHFAKLLRPEEFQYNNIPTELFEIFKTNMEPYAKQYPVLASILNESADTARWDKFCQIITTRDSYRKNSIFDHHPYYKEYFSDHTLLN